MCGFFLSWFFPGHVRPVPFRSGSGQCPLGQVRSGQCPSFQVMPGQCHSVQVMPGQCPSVRWSWSSMCLPHFSRAVSRCMGGNVVWLSLAVHYRAVGSVYRSTISTEVSPINPEDWPLPSFKTILYSVPWGRDNVNPRLSWEMTSECTYWQAFESSPVMASWRRIALCSSSNCLVCHQFSLSQCVSWKRFCEWARTLGLPQR